MSNVAYLPIEVDRYGACVRQIYIRGMDLTGIAMRAQVRACGDTPGAPLVDLLTVSDDNVEGLRLVKVDTLDGLTVSHVEMVIGEATLKTLPYVGDLGAPTPLAWDWQITIAGRKRRIAKGEFVITGDGVTGADNAPRNRMDQSSPATPFGAAMRTGATLTFGEENTTIAIDDASLLAPLFAGARAAADQASRNATLAMSAADAAVAAHNAFPNRAAGEAATDVGGLFSYRDGDSGQIVLAQRTSAGSVALSVYFGADKIAVDGWTSLAAAIARMVTYDANHHLAIGTDTVNSGLVEIATTAVGAPATRGLVISHHADGVGSYGIDLRAYAGASTAQVIHVYSGFSEDGPNCGGGLQIDHTKTGFHLTLKNDENPVTSPGTRGTASFLNIIGYGGPNRDKRVTTLLEWRHDNVLLLPDPYSPLTFQGAGVAVNGTTATRGPALDVSAAKPGQPALNVSGKDVGLQVITEADGDNTVNIVKGGKKDGNVIRVVNGGFGHMLLLTDGAGTQKAVIDAGGNYYVGQDKVLGARGAGLPPRATDLETAISLLNAIRARMIEHGLVAA